MKKRLICLLLSVIMLLSCCLAGCSQQSTDDAINDTAEKASESTVTLAMYLISDKDVSAEQTAKIQEAVNKITKSKFKVQLILNFFSSEEEYYNTLDKKYDEHAAALKDPNSALNKSAEALKNAESTTEETVLNEYGIPELKYPTIQDFQVDILYISDYDRVMDYIEEDRLSDLSDELRGSSSIINSYVAPQYLNYTAEICGSNYAIPTNQPIGNYTYLLLNKELLAEYSYSASDFTNLVDQNTQNFLKRVSESSTDYLPLKSFTGELDVINTQYFGIEEIDGKMRLSNKFSLYGGAYKTSWNYLVQDQYTPFAKILNDTNFMSQLETIVGYREKGYYGSSADADKDFAVGYIKGGVEVMEEYGDEYELVVVEKPTLTTYDIFNNMFAVSSNTVSVSRSMEIISYMYTNEDFRNLLLYGIEGENYKLCDSDVKDSQGNTIQYVERLNEDYVMAPEKTGNVALAYPLLGQPLNIREFYKQQNYDAKISYILGFTHDYGEMSMNRDTALSVKSISDRAFTMLMETKSISSLRLAISNINVMCGQSFTAFGTLEDTASDTFDMESTSMHTMYNTWLIDTGLLVIETAT